MSSANKFTYFLPGCVKHTGKLNSHEIVTEDCQEAVVKKLILATSGRKLLERVMASHGDAFSDLQS